MSSGVLGIAERLRTLASDPEHRHAIVHDQHMLSTLTVFLENSADTPAVRRTTLDTLEYLAMHAPNRLAMRSEPGLSAAVRKKKKRKKTVNFFKFLKKFSKKKIFDINDIPTSCSPWRRRPTRACVRVWLARFWRRLPKRPRLRRRR
jgi:hypothetical protein